MTHDVRRTTPWVWHCSTDIMVTEGETSGSGDETPEIIQIDSSSDEEQTV